MAELPADSPNKGSDEPMTTEVKFAQPLRTDITSTSSEENMAREVEDAANSASPASLSGNEANESAGEGFGIHGDPAAGTAADTDARVDVKKKKKKSKKPPKSRRGITGFEGEIVCKLHKLSV